MLKPTTFDYQNKKLESNNWKLIYYILNTTDTERLYTDATQRILNKFGDQVYTFDVKLSLMGMVHMDMCRKIVDVYKLPITPEEYSKLQKQINSEIMTNAQFMPGNCQ